MSEVGRIPLLTRRQRHPLCAFAALGLPLDRRRSAQCTPGGRLWQASPTVGLGYAVAVVHVVPVRRVTQGEPGAAPAAPTLALRAGVADPAWSVEVFGAALALTLWMSAGW